MNHIKISQIISDYPAGTRVELIKMDDNIHPIAPGTKAQLILLMIQDKFMSFGIMEQA